jgi:hypothetical protein
LLKKPATSIHNSQFPPALFELRRDLAEALRAKAGIRDERSSSACGRLIVERSSAENPSPAPPVAQ